jgi:hypothetical protein
MVAVIKTGHSIHRILKYNENKVKEGVAECIGEGNYPMDVGDMDLNMKLNRLLKQVDLNTNVKRNSVHVSLNFDPSETNLEKDRLMEIADTYMQKIGFGEQPYLVYQHHDAGHPHIHIVSIKVRSDGGRIDMQNIGKNQSEKARKQIEKDFGLVAADEPKRMQGFELKPIDVKKVEYGKVHSKRAITNVLEAVLEKYRFTSLPELNAVLRQYNVLAERGDEKSRVYQNKGLFYRILDEYGKPIGVPIKASLFYNKPTLNFLEERFRVNEVERNPYKAKIKNVIDKAFIGKATTLEHLIKVLEKQGIHVALRKNGEGQVYGITYVDHQTKCVFNGSALGKQYSAKAIQERCLQEGIFEPNLLAHSVQNRSGLHPLAIASEGVTSADHQPTGRTSLCPEIGKVLDVVLQPEETSDYMPYQLKKKRRKKKRRTINNQQ